jgi:hypothetical protein
MPQWIHERAKHILAKNPDMPTSEAFGIATQQSHATGKSPKGFGTVEGRRKAKIKYENPKGMVKKPNPGHLKTEKLAFIEALPTLTGLSVGYNPGRSVAGEAAAALAPKGRVQRSENIARNAAIIGAPLGGLAAMALAKKYNLAPRIGEYVARTFPKGIIAEPSVEKEIVHLGIPGASAIGGSLAGGGLTGALIGGIQHLRGPTHKEKRAELKPSPMWSSIGGGASNKPAWRAQSGFTPTGMTTPAEKLQKSMSMGKVDGSAGLKPLDIKVAEVNQMRLHPKPTLKIPAAAAPNPTFRPKVAFQMSQYSGDMSMPPMQYASGIPPFKDPPVKTAGPPSERGRVKKAGIGQETLELMGSKAAVRPRRINLEPYTRPLMGVLDDIAPIVMRKQRMKAEEAAAEKTAGLEGLAKLGAALAKMSSVTSPASQLSKSQSFGAPRATAPAGPSIAQISKPVGFGRAISGAKKGTAII